MERKQILRIVLTALFAALIAAGAFIRIPLVPAPMTLQTLFLLIAALCLPFRLAVASTAAYLFLGAVGLPVFTSGGGLAALLGPTGGYLIGLLPASVVGAAVMLIGKGTRIAAFLSASASTIIVYLVGLPWLSMKLGGLPLAATLSAGLVPFIVGDVLKIAIASAVAPAVRPRIAELLSADE